MSDETNQPGAENGDGAIHAAAPMIISAQYIKDLSFENPLGTEALAALTEAPSVEIEVKTNVRQLAPDAHEVTLLLRGEATAGDKTLFIVELTYGGLVSVGNLPEEAIEPVLYIDAARHLFPFARAIIANVTRDGGFPPMMINPIDFAALYLEQNGNADGDVA